MSTNYNTCSFRNSRDYDEMSLKGETKSGTGAVKVTAKKHRWYLGGIASAMAASCTHPLDLLKVLKIYTVLE